MDVPGTTTANHLCRLQRISLLDSGNSRRGGDVGRLSSLQIDSQGQVHITYFDVSNTALKYAYQSGTSWQMTTIATLTRPLDSVSLALDRNDAPHRVNPTSPTAQSPPEIGETSNTPTRAKGNGISKPCKTPVMPAITSTDVPIRVFTPGATMSVSPGPVIVTTLWMLFVNVALLPSSASVPGSTILSPMALLTGTGGRGV